MQTNFVERLTELTLNKKIVWEPIDVSNIPTCLNAWIYISNGIKATLYVYDAYINKYELVLGESITDPMKMKFLDVYPLVYAVRHANDVIETPTKSKTYYMEKFAEGL